MEKAEQTMLENLYKNTGKTLEEWVEMVNQLHFQKHGEIIKFLKENHNFTHGFANLVAHKSRGSDAGSAANTDDLIIKQYVGKEHFISLYDKLIQNIKKYGDDIEIAPKISYVSLKRKKQFAILQPATKNRFEIGLNLKNHAPNDRLILIESKNSMCSHKINLKGIEDLDDQVLEYLKSAYSQAG